jgi:hypothetical protein
MPSIEVNRLGAAAMLVLAISELPEPGDDLVEQAEQLCQFIRGEFQSDGSLSVSDPKEAKPSDDDHAGQALYALMRSQQNRPETWKTDAVRKSLSHYRTQWQADKRAQTVPWRTAAYAEAYLRAKDQACSEFVFAMSDWLCGQQLGADPRRPLWQGGFNVAKSGAEPTIESSACAVGLPDACRVARQAGDAQRFGRYREATEKCLQYFSTLQYMPSNSRHFKEDYQERLNGAFYASHHDGNVRLDYTQHAVCMMVHHLQNVAEIGPKGRGGR